MPTHALTAPVEVDVVIVGAGISGAFLANEPARDFTVAVVDRRGPVLGSAMASTAMLQWELDLPLTALAEKLSETDARRVYARSRAAVADLIKIVRTDTLQKFSAVHARSTTSSTRRDTSSAAKSTSRDAPLRWRPGGRSWPRPSWVGAHCVRAETSCRWTDTTTISARGVTTVTPRRRIAPDIPAAWPWWNRFDQLFAGEIDPET